MSDHRQLSLSIPPHGNHGLFADHYLDHVLPGRAEWARLAAEATPVLAEITRIFAAYVPSADEAQTEAELIRPILAALGHTYEVQARLQVPGRIHRPDYVLYRDLDARNANRNTVLDKTLPQQGGLAVADAKYWGRPLDSRQGGRGADDNTNPAFQIYWYLLHSGVAWGVLTNGKAWRLVHRDTADRLDVYYEVDVQELVQSGDVSRFLYFYAFFRRAAFDPGPLGLAELLRASIDYAHGVSATLKAQVYDALRHVAQGFLDYAPNGLADDPETLKTIYDNALILLYRLIFILYAEARELLPIRESAQYRETYSLLAIKRAIARDLAAGRRLLPTSARIWPQLKELFGFIDRGAPPLHIATFNGGLFDPQKHPFLEQYTVGDAHLQQAIDMLARVNGEFIDYRDLAVRHMGTIYEGLLEFKLTPITPSPAAAGEGRGGGHAIIPSHFRGGAVSGTGSHFASEPCTDEEGVATKCVPVPAFPAQQGSIIPSPPGGGAGEGSFTIDLVNDKGERKATGSYYTPDYIVKFIVEHAVGPALREAVAGKTSDAAKVRAVLEVNVLDPAMGSGHFLVEAVEYIARFLVDLGVTPEPQNPQGSITPSPAAAGEGRGGGHAIIPSPPGGGAGEGSGGAGLPAVAHSAKEGEGSGKTGTGSHFAVDACADEEGVPTKCVPVPAFPEIKVEADLAYWKRRVAQSCIYGVDLNPLAVELAKLSLWLTTVAKDRPLSFLDHHLRPGNSLVGTRLTALQAHEGAPAAKKRKKAKAAEPAQTALFTDADFTQRMAVAVGSMWLIEENDAFSVAQVKEQERLYEDLRRQLIGKYGKLADLLTARHFGAETPADLWPATVDFVMGRALGVPQPIREVVDAAMALAQRERFFHWELEFPEVYFDRHGRPLGEDGGFEAVIGNPPWERIKLQENEFFAGRDTAITHAPRAADRKRLIKALPETNPALWREYEEARERTEAMSAYMHRPDLYPLMGKGDTNYYAIFAEKAVQLVRNTGHIGLLTPSGIATDNTTKDFFQHVVTNKMLAGLLDFENRQGLFAEIHRSFKFCIILLAGAQAGPDIVRCGFFLHSMEDVYDPERICELTADDFRLFNPNTLTCPIFRRRRDAELTRKIYQHAPVLIEKAIGDAGNPWGARFSTMFHMTNDSHLFRTAAELEGDGFWLGQGNIYTKGTERYVPLYEGKMVQMYDHRAATIKVNPNNLHRPAQEQSVTLEEHQDPEFSPMPQFWVNEEQVERRMNADIQPWQLGFKEITAPTNIRTFISTALPPIGFGNKIPLVLFNSDDMRRQGGCLVANFNCFAFDYATRQKIGGQTLNFFIVEQFPVLPPERYAERFHDVVLTDFIKARVLELCYTAHDLQGFAEDMGYDGPPFAWDEERRLHLRCQLDALYFHLYGLTRDEAGEILDTFPIVRRQDEAAYGRYRTKDLILAYYNAYGAGNMDAWVKG